jgi:Mrp family chromosome partitioning ATPase
MANRRKQDINYDNVLSVRAANGALQRTFDADVVQSMRYMATELTLNSKLPPRVAIIAALHGEGVTHTAVALGLTLANDTGTKVCVIELNWWSPGMITLLDPKMLMASAGGKRSRKKKELSSPQTNGMRYPGLAKALSGEVSIDDAIIHSDMPNFDLIPAGDVPIARRPAIARNIALRHMLDQLSTRYDHLLLDIPAVRATSDSIVLASLSNACIVVAQQGVTSTTSVQKALDDVKSLTMLGVVLNKVSVSMPYWIRALVPQE